MSEPAQFDNLALVGSMGARLKEFYCVLKIYITTPLTHTNTHLKHVWLKCFISYNY